MKILFLVYHGFSEYSGISKKIHYQVKGLRENGHDVRLCYYDFSPEGHRCRYVDGKVIKDYGTGDLAAFRQRLSYGAIYDYCIQEGVKFVYARCFHNANPWLIRLFKRMKKVGIHAVTEISVTLQNIPKTPNLSFTPISLYDSFCVIKQKIAAAVDEDV